MTTLTRQRAESKPLPRVTLTESEFPAEIVHSAEAILNYERGHRTPPDFENSIGCLREWLDNFAGADDEVASWLRGIRAPL